jgi:hypothetical protein
MVEALCYKPEGLGFETRRGKLFFSIYLILPAAIDPDVHSTSSRNEYQKRKIMFLGSRARPVRKANRPPRPVMGIALLLLLLLVVVVVVVVVSTVGVNKYNL